MPPSPTLKGKPALLISDMQNTFCHPEGIFVRNAAQIPPETTSEVIKSINRLRAAFHAKNLPVIYVGYGFEEDYSNAGILFDSMPQLVKEGICKRGSWDAEIIQELKIDEAKREIFVEKYRYTAFYESKLEEKLKELGVEQLVVTGCATNFCVESTVRDAHVRGWHVITVSDGTGTLTKEMHEMSLGNLMWFGGVCSTEEILKAI